MLLGKENQKKNIWRFVLIMILLCIVWSKPCLADTSIDEGDTQQRVLFISSYSFSWGTIPLQIEGIQSVLENDYVINYEFMDTKNTSYSKDYKEYYELLKYKLGTRESYDAVIVGDDAALNFITMYQEDLFPHTPIVFEGIDNIENAKKAAKNPYITGVVEQVDYKKNIDIASKLIPDAKKLIFIVDNAENGIGVQQQLDANKKVFSKFDIEYLNASDYSKQDFGKCISKLRKDSIVFCISMSKDKNGVIYTEEERYKVLNENSKVPMFRVTNSGVGQGTLVGGYVVSHKESGMIAAKMVKEALTVGVITSIDIDLETPSEYYFDHKVMKKYQLKESLLPEKSTVINPEATFLEKYYVRVIAVSILAIILLLLLLLRFYISNNIKKEKLNEKLEEKNRELEKTSTYKSDFLANMSHEIRTPMNAIIGMTKLARDTAIDGTTKDYLQQIEDSSDYMLSVLNDVLDMSRIDNGKFELHPEWVYAEDVLRPCVQMLQTETKEKNIEFIFPNVSAAANIEVYVDALRTQQVIMNILNNAYKFTPEGGQIQFSIRNIEYKDGHSKDQLMIRDTGCGMSQEFMKRMFQPFEQERTEKTYNIQGTGLGLALVKQIIDAMGGDIRVESELDHGTTFVIDFPYEYRMAKNPQKNQSKKTAPIQLQGKKVLLVDDHPTNLMIARKLLEKKGMLVDIAENGLQAVEQFCGSKIHNYDVILMDIRMPVMDGLEATRHIRDLDREDAKSIPIIAMTANAFQEDKEKTKEAGMNAHLAKPVEPEKLYETILEQI